MTEAEKVAKEVEEMPLSTLNQRHEHSKSADQPDCSTTPTSILVFN